MGTKQSMDPGLQYLLEIGFNRIKGKFGLADRFNRVFGRAKGKELWDTWQRLGAGTKEFYDFKNSDPEISKAFSEAYDGDIIRKACNYIDSHKDYFGSTILEVGCDCGMISCFLAKTFPDAKIVSIDRCAAAIEIAKSFAKQQGLENIVFLCCELKNAEGVFDTVFSMRTLLENINIEEDVTNDLGEQAAIFSKHLMAHAASLSRLLTDHGRLISIERIGRTALLLGWMEAMDAVELAFDLSCYEEIICEEAGNESTFEAFVCFKGIETGIAPKDMFDFACSKYLDYTQAEYGGWDAKIVFENRRGKLIEGYTWEWPERHTKGRMSLWTHATDETGLISYQNNNGSVTTVFYDISQKDELLEAMHKTIEQSHLLGNITITEMSAQ